QSVTNNWAQSETVEAVLDERTSRRPLTLDQLRSIEPDRPGAGLYFADAEIYRLSVKARRSLTDRVQIGLALPVMRFHGGIGDAPIQETHEAFGIPPTGREGVPRDAFALYVRRADGEEVFLDQAPSAALGDMTATLKLRLTPAESDWLLAVEGVAKLPTGDEESLYGSGEVDYGAQLLGTAFFSRSCLHLGLGAVRTGGSEVLGVGERTVWNLFLGYEHRLARNWSWVVQGTFSESPLGELEIPGLTEDQFLIDLALKRGVGRRGAFFVALSENYRNFGSSPDVGLHVGFSAIVR
ncbi:MAG: DUF3187 family protein, partial [Thermoanaerobaculia bacterium]|nr:DUF3187 family protein [Thermoanaerobaculia bacterium]